nr:reverse transcriptase domain-containing protein [Tanacetum cinerariifolium]
MEEKTALITVLKSHKRAIAQKLSDIKGIDPEFCTHKILMEEDFEPAVQHQRRVNSKIHDVIKNETGRTLIYVFEGELTLRIGKEAITFNLDQTSRYSTNYNYMTANQIDVIDMACEEYSQEFLCFFDVIASGNPTPYYDPIVSTTSPTLTPFGNSNFLLEEVDAFLALEDGPTSPEVDQSYELKICEAKSDKSSIDEPPEVELKDLPPHLEYAFLEEYVEAFQTLKRKLTNAPILIVLDWDLPFELMCDASDFAIGAVLGQRQEKHFRPIHYASKTMTEAESNYTTTKKEMLAVVNSFQTCLSHLEKMLKRCEDTNLCLNWEKSHFMVKEGIVLGYKISKNGIEVDKSKVDVIAKLPHPTTVKGIRKLSWSCRLLSTFYKRLLKDSPADDMSSRERYLIPFLQREDFEPTVQHQRRVNPKIHDVIKNEVLKLLDAGLIYPIFDNPWSHKRAIAQKLSDIKGIDPEFCTHKILMEEDFEPAVQHQRRVNSKIHDVIKNEVLKLLDAGLIYSISDSPWLNEATRKDHFSLPFMDQMLERLARNQYYCFLEGYSGYFQIPIDPKDQDKTTFTCPYGTFSYRRMPFGLCNAPGTFQRCMMAIFHDMIEKPMEVFIDDFLVFKNSFQTCLSHLEKMLKLCEGTNLCLNWEKSYFMVKEGIVLGHKISKNGIEVDKAKVDVIAKLPHPTTVKCIRSFLGHAGFYRRFIQDFSKIARPMTRHLEKDTPFLFSKECVEAF